MMMHNVQYDTVQITLVKETGLVFSVDIKVS